MIFLYVIRGVIMLAVNYTNLRDNMKAYMDKVTDDYETMFALTESYLPEATS